MTDESVSSNVNATDLQILPQISSGFEDDQAVVRRRFYEMFGEPTDDHPLRRNPVILPFFDLIQTLGH